MDMDEGLSPDAIKLESTDIDLAALKLEPNYKEVRYKDALYLGGIQNGQRHGKGVMKYRNGR